MNQENINLTKELIAFIEKCPTAFHAVAEIGTMLEAEGFVRLSEGNPWDLVPGGKYYVTRNLSSFIAFAIPENASPSFMVTASHTDSPTFKLKTDSETDAFGKYVKLNVEGYGGIILPSWFDRPLSVAGRVIVKEGDKILTKLANVDRDLLVIPHVAIHLCRGINNGYNYNMAVDLMPLYGGKDQKGSLRGIVAEAAGCRAEDMIGADLFLYNRTPASIWGADNEFFSCPRIDNLRSTHGTLMGFLNAIKNNTCGAIPVCASFDNEETGSSSKQGADSQFLFDTLTRICEAIGTTLPCALASSFMLSSDSAHARHPNHPEYSDALNTPHLNEGVVIKSNAAQRYTTDGVSAAIFGEICKKAGVPTQLYANRSDISGGSTLGSISNTNVALNSVDIGLSQLAMHSAYETGGCADTVYMIRAAEAFFSSVIRCEGDGMYVLN